jgi:Response regulator containing CheY-like receiver, AAA-type ATPase, and DNA-binding domains
MDGRQCRLTDAAIRKLESYEWPGNVRELENVIERSLVLCSNQVLDAQDVKLDTAQRRQASAAGHFLPEGMNLDQFEQSIIREALQRADGK